MAATRRYRTVEEPRRLIRQGAHGTPDGEHPPKAGTVTSKAFATGR